MGVEITTQLAPEAAEPELRDLADEFGLSVRPLHAGTSDPVLGSYYIVSVPDASMARQVLDRLRQSPAVNAAYLKPPDAMP
jgi:hypothetical protein